MKNSRSTSFKLSPNVYDAEKLMVTAHYNEANATITIIISMTDFNGEDVYGSLYKEIYCSFNVFERSLNSFPKAVQEALENAIYSHQHEEMVDRYMQAFNVSPLYN